MKLMDLFNHINDEELRDAISVNPQYLHNACYYLSIELQREIERVSFPTFN
jgi:hypothetical protein